jgi:NAD(P)-dependent dehydrogenase (short-subunit alcohol dehydrogenase family)
VATIVLTGASDGIGAAAAVELTQLGHSVLATGRSEEKLDRVHARMVDAAPPDAGDVPVPIAADLSAMADVRDLATQLLDRCSTIDVLVNNAGLQTRRRETSPDGFELVLAVNHLAPFLLTELLLGRVRESGGRVVTTSSAAHRVGGIDFDDLQMERRWGGFRSYGRSKLANIWFTAELARRTDVAATCFHPGSVNTALNRDSAMARSVQPIVGRFMRTPDAGADTLVWLATADEGEHPGAVYYADRAPGRTSKAARDAAAASRLWDVSAELVGV